MDGRGQIRQGDVLLVPVAPPRGELVRAVDRAGQPLAGLRIEGECTGHAHVLPAEVWQLGSDRLLHIAADSVMSHEEHAAVTVPPGWWRPVTQREYVPRERTWRGHTARRWD